MRRFQQQKPKTKTNDFKIRKKRVCRHCTDKQTCRDLYIDFKDTKKLSRFLSEQGKMIPKRTSGNCARSQRQLSIAIKRARHLALLPYVSDIPR
jgi:small subunit ribosomal protein S18